MLRRKHLDILNSKSGGVTFTSATVNANTKGTINLPSNYRGVLFASASSSANNGAYLVFCTGAGGVTMVAVREASGISFESVTNAIQITPSSQTKITLLNIAGIATT